MNCLLEVLEYELVSSRVQTLEVQLERLLRDRNLLDDNQGLSP